jgi:predicted nucleic acid-binding Zn ribbon protein
MPWEPLPGSSPEPVPVDRGLQRVLHALGTPSTAAMGSLFDDWVGLVGEQLATHARPVRLRASTLVLAVDDPAWATQVRWMTAEVLERLAAGLGEGVVTELEVRVEGSQR